jgi:hypothetical protein
MTPRFEDRLRTANLAISALAESLFDRDAARMHADALRLQHALEVVERTAIAIGVGQVDYHPMAAAVLYQLHRVAHPLLTQSGVDITQRYLVRLRLRF